MATGRGILPRFCVSLSLVALTATTAANAANILLVAMQMSSHVIEQLALGDFLVARGHVVYVVLGSRHSVTDESVRQHGIVPIRYHVPDDILFTGSTEDFHGFISEYVFDDPPWWRPRRTEYFDLALMACAECRLMMSDAVFLERVKSIGFHLSVAEPFILCPCAPVLPQHLGIPFVSMADVMFTWFVGIPTLPSYWPPPGQYATIDRMSFVERLVNVYHTLSIYVQVSLNYAFLSDTALLAEFTPGVTSYKELVGKSQLFLWLIDHHLDYHVPLPPHVIQLPGLTTRAAATLPPDLLEIFDAADEHGVVLVSFGSAAYHLPSHVLRKFLDAFAALPLISFVARLAPPTNDSGLTVPPNAHLRRWLPQNDALGHRNTRLFLTHCGNNGQYEALHHGVPMIGFPLFAEQHHNCGRIRAHGFGPDAGSSSSNLDDVVRRLRAEDLRDLVTEALTNPAYRERIGRASRLWRAAQDVETSGQKAVRWIEHVLEFGGEHLRSSPLRELSTGQLLCVDVFGVVLLAAALLVWGCRKLAAVCWLRLRHRPVVVPKADKQKSQ